MMKTSSILRRYFSPSVASDAGTTLKCRLVGTNNPNRISASLLLSAFSSSSSTPVRNRHDLNLPATVASTACTGRGAGQVALSWNSRWSSRKRCFCAVAQASGGDRRRFSRGDDDDDDHRVEGKPQPLELRKVTILKKTSRYEYEKSLAPGVNDCDLEQILASRGSDFRTLLARHDVHLANVERLQRELTDRGVSCLVLDTAECSHDVIDSSDAIFTAGGDGTFLMAANLVVNRDKPVVGINTDPTRSEGHLCLPKHYTHYLGEGIERLLRGNFRWLMRKRIRLSTTKRKDAPFPTPTLLKDQTPTMPEQRFTEHEQEINDSKVPPNSWEIPSSRINDACDDEEVVVLPSRALNDVFIGETISARVSYFELSIDGQRSLKHKCSGLVIATGTGSNSWYLNIHKLSSNNIQKVIEILRQELGPEVGEVFPDLSSSHIMERVAKNYNRSLTFDPRDHKMAYIVRDPIVNRVFRSECPEHGFADSLLVRSRMYDACLVIDGGISYSFNDGAKVSLSMHDEDSLRTVRLRD